MNEPPAGPPLPATHERLAELVRRGGKTRRAGADKTRRGKDCGWL